MQFFFAHPWLLFLAGTWLGILAGCALTTVLAGSRVEHLEEKIVLLQMKLDKTVLPASTVGRDIQRAA